MKKLLILLFLTISLSLTAQSRLGSTMEDIKKEFPNGTLKTLSNGVIAYIIELKSSDIRVSYLFDGNTTCDATAIYPNSIATINYFAELYNKKYTIISSTKWRAYFTEGVSNIELVFNDNMIPYFLWTLQE